MTAKKPSIAALRKEKVASRLRYLKVKEQRRVLDERLCSLLNAWGRAQVALDAALKGRKP